MYSVLLHMRNLNVHVCTYTQTYMYIIHIQDFSQAWSDMPHIPMRTFRFEIAFNYCHTPSLP